MIRIFLMAMAIALLCLPAGAGGRATFLSASGRVEILAPGAGAAGTASTGLEIPDGATIACRENATAQIDLAGAAVADLTPGASIRVLRADGRLDVRLLGGRATVTLKEGGLRLSAEGGEMAVQGPNGLVTTLGRGQAVEFGVSEGTVTAECREGEVVVRQPGAATLLQAGESASLRAHALPPAGGMLHLSGAGVDVDVATPAKKEGPTGGLELVLRRVQPRVSTRL